MTGNPPAFAGSVPEFYERYMRGPFFEPYAVDMASRVASLNGPFLELACGTGVLTRQLLARLPEDASLTATDLNPPMLAEAQRRVAEDPRLAWAQADMTALPFPDRGFGTVVCQFGFMFPPDKAAIFREARRMMRPGGTLLFSVWDTLEANPANPVVLRVLSGLCPADPPRFLEAPFGFNHPPRLRALLEEAGFARIHLEVVPKECRSSSARELALGLLRGTPLAGELAARGTDLERAEALVTEALADLGGAAPCVSPMSALVVQARS